VKEEKRKGKEVKVDYRKIFNNIRGTVEME
jgi:hypothetical protein